MALTDRRLLAAYGLVRRSCRIDYAAIHQIQTGLTKVEVDGAGVSLEIKAVGRRDELVAAPMRAAGSRSVSRQRPAPPGASSADLMATLTQLAELRDAGV